MPWNLVLNIGPVIVMLLLGYGVGRIRERRHFASLDEREELHAGMKVTNLKRITDPQSVQRASLVTGDAVIATDYFKSFAARLRNIVGGEIKAYVTLMERARREATLRMLEQARAMGADEVWNVRFETSNIRSGTRKRNNPGVSVEIFAFGTAVARK